MAIFASRQTSLRLPKSRVVNPVAVKVVPENFQAIISEGGTKDLGTTTAENSLAFLQGWLDACGEGYFVRDEGSPFDCELIMTEAFVELYYVRPTGTDPIFLRIIKK